MARPRLSRQSLISQGITAVTSAKFSLAQKLFCQALKQSPSSSHIHTLLAATHINLGEYHQARRHLKSALRLDPSNSFALFNQGSLYQLQHQPNEAKKSYLQALTQTPSSALYCQLGQVTLTLGEYRQAHRFLHRALKLDHANSQAYNLLGNLFASQGDFPQAKQAYQNAIKANPLAIEPFTNLAFLFFSTNLLQKAQHILSQGGTIDAHDPHLIALNYFFTRLVCDFPSQAQTSRVLMSQTQTSLTQGETPQESPFINLIHQNHPQANSLVAQAWSAHISRSGLDPQPQTHTRLRVGYLSADIKNHIVARQLKPLLEHHTIQTFVYALNPDDGSHLRHQLQDLATGFRDLHQDDDLTAARIIHRDQLHLLIDLTTYTNGGRLGITAHKPAPIQVNFLGFAGTTGATFYDYIIASQALIPPQHQTFFTEKLLSLPDPYLTLPFSKPPPTHSRTRQQLVLASLNRGYKISYRLFLLWIKLLKRYPHTVLWLKPGNPLAETNLSHIAAEQGIDPARLIFQSNLDSSSHLQRLSQIDLFLDTDTYNGHATTADVLWSGTPVVTLLGPHFASRVTASMLLSLGITELITHNLDDYFSLTSYLICHPQKLQRLRQKISASHTFSPLFQPKLFTHNLETAYFTVWDNYLAGKSPEPMPISDPHPLTQYSSHHKFRSFA